MFPAKNPDCAALHPGYACWAWNNTLSVAQQSVIMHKHGAKIELFDNLKAVFARKKKADG